MDNMNQSTSDFNMEGEECVAPARELVVEDLPRDFDPEVGKGYHDQLPSVEEYKASFPTKGKGNSRKTYILGLAIVVIILMISSMIAISKKNNKKESSKLPETSGRTKEVEDFLFMNNVSTLPDLQDVKTAQHKAASFIADGDTLQMDLSPENAKRFVERYVLSLLYYHFNGHDWSYKLKFLSDRDHCEWWDEFDTKSGKKIRQGVICNEDGYVIGLNLAWNNLKGSHMPREIGYFGQLESINMYYNTIGGDFPESFRGMPHLKSIGLMKTGMTGMLPSWIGEMTQLTALGLGENKFEGGVPQSIENLTNLKLLGLDSNEGLSGNMNRFKSLSKLQALYLENNALTGSLQHCNWPNLLELDVSNNMISEDLPSDIFNHPTLKVLDIHQNLFYGTFPDDVVQNGQLEFLALNNNRFSGTIPDRLGFVSNLQHLDLSFNKFTGSIPDTLAELTGLRYWATSDNDFASQPMLDLSRMTNLKDLAMKSNNLTGTISDWLGELFELQTLDFEDNAFTGSIPTWIGLLGQMNTLLLNRNQLTGTLPSQLENLGDLKVLLLNGNSLKGNADVICESPKVQPSHFLSDCYPGENGQRPEIECLCCTQCCVEDDPSCNNRKWSQSADIDPKVQYSEVRQRYTLSLNNAPAGYSTAAGNYESIFP